MIIKKLGYIKGVVVIGVSMETDLTSLRFSEFDLNRSDPALFPLENISLRFRSVSFDRWDYVRKYGVDVCPTDSVIFCDSLDKASEYGDWPKVVLGYDRHGLDKTYREVDYSVSDEEFNLISNIFPTIEESEDGTKIWLSKMTEDDLRRGTYYETEYARWIPNNPWNSLRLVILADLNDREWDI